MVNRGAAADAYFKFCAQLAPSINFPPFNPSCFNPPTLPAIPADSVSINAIGIPFLTAFFTIAFLVVSLFHAAANILGFFQSIPNSCIPSRTVPEVSNVKEATPHPALAPKDPPVIAPPTIPGAPAADPLNAPAAAPTAAVAAPHLKVAGRKDAIDSRNISGIAMGLSNTKFPSASKNPSLFTFLYRATADDVGMSSISDATSMNFCISS